MSYILVEILYVLIDIYYYDSFLNCICGPDVKSCS